MSSAVPTTKLDDGERAPAHGEADEFARLVEPHRAELHAHCYRMLGSFHDAEDALQDTLVKAWRGLSGLEDRRSLRPWLYRIATNTCLDASARPRRVLPVDLASPAGAGDDFGQPLADSVWIEPYPDQRVGVEDGLAAPEARYEQREAVELAFVAALQHLPANQRAVLIMREVLGYSAREVAEALDATVASVNSALQRARNAIGRRLPERTQQATLRSLGDERVRELVERYADAWNRDDFDALTELLAEDVTFAMPPFPAWWRGRDVIFDFKRRMAGQCAESRFLTTRANGQVALGWYGWTDERGRYVASALELLSLDGARVKEVTAFALPGDFGRFGLPDTYPE